jgi:glycosyltransferase involved in cell wall biosynthesis
VAKKREFLMVLGRRRGVAERVLSIWARHPEWPTLTICGRRLPRDVALSNVRLVHDFISAEELTRLQNEVLFHLAVTKAEGFGHKLNEGFSCGAIVIATDAPPMNEIVAPDRGFLVGWTESHPKALGREYEFDEVSLEKTVTRCLALREEEVARLSANARAWFESNDQFFRRTLPFQLRELLVAAPSRWAGLVPVG